MGFQQIQAPTLRELFVDQVIGMIFSGELRVGARLPSERELSEQMHTAAEQLQFELAARLRDEIRDLKKELRQMTEASK